MRIFTTHTIAAAVFLALQMLPASAATVSYTFSETGWLNTFGTTETFSGSFTGTPEADGTLALGDLSAFMAVMTETNADGQTKNVSVFGDGTGTSPLADFLYLPGSNSLSLEATGSPVAQICLGGDVSSGFCGSLPARPQPRPGTPPLPAIEGLFSFSVNGELDAYTTGLPTVSQSSLTPPIGTAPATAPEPESMLLCGVGLLVVSKGLSRFGGRRGRAR